MDTEPSQTVADDLLIGLWQRCIWMSFVVVYPFVFSSNADAQFDLPFGDVFYESSNFAAGGSGVFNQQMVNERVRGIAIENQKQKMLAEREAILNRRYVQANAWSQMELDAMKRIDREQRQREHDVVHSVEKIRETHRALQAITTCRDGTCFVSLLSDGLGYCQDRTELERMMMISVPPLTTDSFRLPTRMKLGILGRNGRCQRPPSILMGEGVGSPMAIAFCRVKTKLAEGLQHLRSKGHLRTSELQGLRDALAAWRLALDQQSCSDSDRVRGRVYLRQCDRLLAVLGDPRGSAIVRDQLIGIRFSGGTVKDLLIFMKDRHLTAKGGGTAQQILRPLAAEVSTQLASRIHQLEEECEKLQSQSVAHQGTLRDWILQNN
ncbi:MAG: hypothetical protein AAGJ83_03260 [Planctomycetota bacterium]